MSGRKRRSLNKAEMKLMGELILVPAQEVSYQTWNHLTSTCSGWIKVFTDGTSFYETQITVPLRTSKNSFTQILDVLQSYVMAKNFDEILNNYRFTDPLKPEINRKHPYYKALRR
jgi:hypothetical protein